MTMADYNATKSLTTADVMEIFNSMMDSHNVAIAAIQSDMSQAVTIADLKNFAEKLVADLDKLVDAKINNVFDEKLNEKLSPMSDIVTAIQGDLNAASDAICEIDKKSLDDDGCLKAAELHLMQVSNDMGGFKQQLSLLEKALTAQRADVREAIKEVKGDISVGQFKQEALYEDQEKIMDKIRSIKKKQDAYEKSQAAAIRELHERILSSSKSSEDGKSADSITCAPYAPTPKKGSSTRKQ
ncbi:hypothetical protein COL5a_011112 [Colletotrichum fioriniae]|nr:uncharacterized protein COL516b_010445 [Colletotrichum fioriniae]KAJ0297834.1 hypothetical protein COL516b_010445 [Colletotrichum fioriniae]KAJ0317544.1 hypothetical protein COL5a_011112 [Colletotrichum fioriniae]